LAKLLGRPELARDERFSTNDARVENRTALNAVLHEIFKTKTTDEWLGVFEGSSLPYGPVNTIERAFGHAQTQARDMIQTIPWDAATNGMVKVPGTTPV
jgi:succinate--hydroxymethylglutarate CoA-transferase